MVEAGILAEDARVELINGELIDVAPESLPHVRWRRWLTRFFMTSLSDDWQINPDAPAVLSGVDAPEPDIAVFPSHFHDRELTGDKFALFLEVSVSSLKLDLGVKAGLYAKFGIPEYWVVDVPSRRIIVHRDPTPDGYNVVFDIGPDGEVAPLAFPDLTVKVAALPE
jgi:Uma2 family endonuclease